MKVLVELPDSISNADLIPGTPYRLTGLDTDRPILELKGKRYEGRYEETLGTVLIFPKTVSEEDDDTVASTTIKLVFMDVDGDV